MNPLGGGFEMVVQHGHNDGVNSVVFVDHGSILLTASRDGTVKVWDVAEQILLRSIPAHRGSLTEMVLHPDGTRIAVYNDGGNGDGVGLRVIDAATGETLRARAEITSGFRIRLRAIFGSDSIAKSST